MTAFLAGLALIRCEEHDRAAEMDATARLVLAVMASFASEDHDPPECYAARATIAARAGLSLRAAHDALLRLEKLGAIERDGIKGKTVLWYLRLCALDAHKTAPVPDRDTTTDHPDKGARGAHKSGARGAHKKGARGAHNPSESYRGLPRDDDRAEPSADAPGTPSIDPPPHVADVMARLVLPRAEAEEWVRARLARAQTPPSNPIAYLRRCVDNELAGSVTAAPSVRKSAASTAAGKARSKPTPTKRDQTCVKCSAHYRKGKDTPWAEAQMCAPCWIKSRS
jgi:hypothetical protein